MYNTPVPKVKLFFLLLSLSCAISAAYGKLINVTVDDQLGDSIPIYNPARSWNEGPQCITCAAHPDPSQAFKGTWHDTTTQVGDQPYVITYAFNGTAVFAYVILANKNSLAPGGTATFTNLTFTIDGQYEGNYFHQPDQTDLFIYNVSAFAKTGLENSEHLFAIYNNAGSMPSLILFDYLIYTTDDGSGSGGNVTHSSTAARTGNSVLTEATTTTPSFHPNPSTSAGYDNSGQTSVGDQKHPHAESSSSGSPDGLTIGLTIGIVGALVLGALITLLCVRKKQRNRMSKFKSEHEYLAEPPGEASYPQEMTAATASYAPENSDIHMSSSLYKDHGMRWWTWGKDEKTASSGHALPPSYHLG